MIEILLQIFTVISTETAREMATCSYHPETFAIQDQDQDQTTHIVPTKHADIVRNSEHLQLVLYTRYMIIAEMNL